VIIQKVFIGASDHHFQAKAGSGKESLAFLFEEINALKKQFKPEKTPSSKKKNKER
jgi:hypothetical protein